MSCDLFILFINVFINHFDVKHIRGKCDLVRVKTHVNAAVSQMRYEEF